MTKEFIVDDNVAENIIDEIIFNLKKNKITLFEVVNNAIDGYMFEIKFLNNKVVVDGNSDIIQIVIDSIKELNNEKGERNESITITNVEC
jgi:hypothetical protein